MPNAVRARIDGRVRLQSVIHNTGWLFLDRVVRMGAGLALVVIVARYLGPGAFGALSYAAALVGLAASIAGLGLEGIVVRDLVRTPFSAPEILGTTLALRLLAGTVAMAVAIVAVVLLRRGNLLMLLLVAITSVTLVVQALDTPDLWFQSQLQSKYTVFARNAAFLVLAAVRLVLVYVGAPLITFAWASLGEASLAAAGVVVAYNATGHHVRQWRVSAPRARRLVSESWPLLLSAMAIGVYMKLDILMLGQMAGDEAAGTYSVATRISEVWYFIPVAVVSSVAPSLTAAREQGETVYQARLNRLFHGLAAVAIAIAIPMTVLATPFVRLLYGTLYSGAGPILALHIWAALFVFLGVGQSAWTVNEGLTKLALRRTVIGAVSNVLLNLILIPRYAGMGAAIATVVSYGLSAVVLNAFDARTVGIFRSQLRAITLRDYIWRSK